MRRLRPASILRFPQRRITMQRSVGNAGGSHPLERGTSGCAGAV